MPESLPPPEDVQASCRGLGLAMSAAELHGGLCGWLAGGGAAGEGWLKRILADDSVPQPDDALQALHAASVSQLEDRSFGFALLLPGPQATLYQRSEGLFDWCRGFLGGFGLAAGRSPPLSAEGEEALADLAKLAAADPQEGGDEEDEQALAEIEEFVRVAALLLHGDCAMGPRHRQQLN